MGFKILDLEQGSRKWLDFRKGKISATMAPIIMGESPFCTPYQLWEDIMMDVEKEITPAMQRGIELEEKAREWISHELNMKFVPVVVQSIERPMFIASLDGYFLDENGDIYIIEIKCPGFATGCIGASGFGL